MIPTVSDERAMAVRREVPAAAVHLATPWRENGPILALVFFALTCVGLGAVYGFFELIDLPAGLITGVLALALAELLIQRHRFFGTGIESALWIGGLFSLIFALPGLGQREALLLFAAAAAIAGARVLNPWFGALSSTLVIGYLVVKQMAPTAVIVSVAIALCALAALSRSWRRPSTERLFALLLITAPIAGAVGDFHVRWVTLHLAFAMICFVAGIRLRHHAPLLGGLVGVALAAIDAHEFLRHGVEWYLIAGGAALFAIAALISRRLRGRTSGIVATPSELTPYDEALQLGATIALTPAAPPPGQTPRDGGGSFGGAGATGDF